MLIWQSRYALVAGMPSARVNTEARVKQHLGAVAENGGRGGAPSSPVDIFGLFMLSGVTTKQPFLLRSGTLAMQECASFIKRAVLFHRARSIFNGRILMQKQRQFLSALFARLRG